MKIVVIGGTGLIGSKVVEKLRQKDHQVLATAVAEAALAAPLNATAETAGPDTFHLDELVGRVLAHDKDPRKVIADPAALYYGVKVNDQTLRPGPNPRLGATKFDWWLTHVP